MRMGIAGLLPGPLNGSVLRITSGEVYDATGAFSVENPGNYDIDINASGVGGLDAGSPVNGEDYFVYVLKNATAAEFGAVLSASIIYGGVIVPSGWSMVRKLRYGFVYDSRWGGIPAMHVSAWPWPIIRLTDAEYSGLWMPLYNTASKNVWTSVNLQPWIPDNARMAFVGAEVRYASGQAGSGYLRSYGAQQTGVIVGTGAPSTLSPGPRFLTMRVDSQRNLQFRTTGDVTMYIQVLGYEITEPS